MPKSWSACPLPRPRPRATTLARAPGSTFPDTDRAIPAAARLGDIDLYLGRWDQLTETLGRLSQGAAVAAPTVAEELTFVYQSSSRITANLRRIYQAGYYSKFLSI